MGRQEGEAAPIAAPPAHPFAWGHPDFLGWAGVPRAHPTSPEVLPRSRGRAGALPAGAGPGRVEAAVG